VSARKDGGPAFPSDTRRTHEFGSSGSTNTGMSLRDYFAAEAMHAHLMTDGVPGPACDALVEAANRAGRDPIDHLAVNAYEVADAMLRARKAE